MNGTPIMHLAVSGLSLAASAANPLPHDLDAAIDRPIPPFRILFNNDLTNVVNCESPYNSIRDPFSTSSLQASVRETSNTGIDVHALSPGHGWEPLWISESYPYLEHARWYRERTGMEVSTFGKYMLNGGDVVGDFVEYCREVNMPAFISFRLNDWHHKNYVDLTREQLEEFGITRLTSMETSRFYDDHPEYRLLNLHELPDPRPEGLQQHIETYRNQIKANNLQDWSIPAVRQHKFAFIGEIVRNYAIDGLELDFMRHNYYFKKGFPLEARARIMTGFVQEVRALLDETTPAGEYRWLCLRIPSRLGDLVSLGLDLASLQRSGVDMFIVSHSYESEQQNDLARICGLVAGAAVYLEITPVVARYARMEVSGSRHNNRNEDMTFIMTRPEHYYTSAHLAYSRGAKGVSLFNFAYYRHYGSRPAEFAREPFFGILKTLSCPDTVATLPQHYYLGDFDSRGARFSGTDLTGGLHKTYALDMAPPRGGWRNVATMRIQVEPSWNGVACEVVFNGQILDPADDIAEPYETDLKEGRGDEKSLLAWAIPREILVDGLNLVEIRIPKGCESKLVLMDIAVK